MRLSRNSQHFSLYTVRVTRFKEICDEAGIRYQTLLGYGNTRFSAFRGCIDRIISQFDALKIYFTQSDDSDSELYDFFSYPASKLVLIFVRDQCALFEVAIKKIEGNEVTGFAALDIMSELKTITEGRLRSSIRFKFIPPRT